MSVVRGGRDGDRPGAPDVGVAELVGQLLQLVSIEVIVVPEDMVVAGTRGALDTWRRINIVDTVMMGSQQYNLP